MEANETPISGLISIQPRFLRSVHLERDFYSKDSAEGYLLTRGSLSALSLIARGSLDASYRAQCITGPYGSGKSALAMYFTRLLDRSCPNAVRNRARLCLGDTGKGLIPPQGQGYISVLATGTRESLTTCLIAGLKRTLERLGSERLLEKLRRRHEPVFEQEKMDGRAVTGLFEDLAKISVESGKAVGIVIVLDELGKLLEHAALNPEESDIQLLQEMAEAASRSDRYPLWFITILHQEFSHYASRLGRRHQREWSKVQQRFFEVPHLLDDSDSLQLISAALNSCGHQRVAENKYIVKTAESCRTLAPRGWARDFEELCKASYPIHPTALVVMPSLFKRFGQNERSLFSFLSAHEPFSLANWVEARTFDADDPPFIRLPHMYEYAFHTLIGGAPNPQVAHLWAEVEDATMRLGDALPEEIDVIKAVGVLGLVGDSSHITASRGVLILALSSPGRPAGQIENALRSLEAKRLIVFRRFRNAYRLWEGSDIDISERLAEAYQTLPPRSVVLTVARELCPCAPLVASRHSFRTGMLRLFRVISVSAEGLAACVERRADCDGRVVQCLVEDDEQAASIGDFLRKITDPSVITVVGRENDELAEVARDVMALEWVRKNTPALSGDRIARQELGERRLEAEMSFRSEWQKVFGPASRDFTCFWCGNEHRGMSARVFASMLSDACDATFPHAPVVKNELINRRSLSSAAAAARRNLIEAMISSGEKPNLGFVGYPAQRSIYESLLAQSRIHREDKDGRWGFGRPDETDRGLQKAWDHILESVDGSDLKPKSVNELSIELTGSPYGVAKGFVPVLLCACLMANSSTMALYEDRAFVPDLSVPVMERLMRSPHNFSIASFQLSGERAHVVERFSRGFNVPAAILPVVRSLYQRMNSLPKYTQMSPSLPPEAIAVRETILRARSPERLLFVDLPSTLGYEPFGGGPRGVGPNGHVEGFFKSLNKAFETLIVSYPNLLGRVRNGLLEIFDVAADEKDWIEVVSSRASGLRDAVVDSRLGVLLLRASYKDLGQQEYLEATAAAIVGQPPNRWTQVEEDAFAHLIPELASKVRAAESVRRLNSVLEPGEPGYLLSISGREGEPMRAIVRFQAAERGEIERLIAVLTHEANGANRRVLLAAITEVARRLLNEDIPAHDHYLRGEVSVKE